MEANEKLFRSLDFECNKSALTKSTEHHSIHRIKLTKLRHGLNDRIICAGCGFGSLSRYRSRSASWSWCLTVGRSSSGRSSCSGCWSNSSDAFGTEDQDLFRSNVWMSDQRAAQTAFFPGQVVNWHGTATSIRFGEHRRDDTWWSDYFIMPMKRKNTM